MIKKLRTQKKFFVASIFAVSMIVSTTVMATLTLTCTVSKSLLKKSATAEAYSCAAVGCIIYGKNGDILASGENGYYNTNSYRTKTVSYTGLSSADYAYAYAVDTAGNIITKNTDY